MVRVDLEYRDVGLGIAPHKNRVILLAGIQFDVNLVGVLDHMVIGENETFLVENKAGTEAAPGHGASGSSRSEEPLKRISELLTTARIAAMRIPPEAGTPFRRLVLGCDIDHGIAPTLGELDKIRERASAAGSCLLSDGRLGLGFGQRAVTDGKPARGKSNNDEKYNFRNAAHGFLILRCLTR